MDASDISSPVPAAPALSSAARIAAWYERHCNGDWEHMSGVKIETLDNPGWQIKADLSGTSIWNYRPSRDPNRKQVYQGGDEGVYYDENEGTLAVFVIGANGFERMLDLLADELENAPVDPGFRFGHPGTLKEA